MHIVPRGSGAIDSKPVSRSFGVLLLRMTAGAYCLEHSQNDVTASPTRPLCHPELAEGSCPKLKSQEPLPVTPFPIRPYPTGERSPLPQAYFKILRSIAPQDDSGGEIRGSASFSRKLISKSFVAPLLRMTKGGGERFARGAGVNCYCSGKILRQAQDDKGVFAAFKPIWYYSFE